MKDSEVYLRAAELIDADDNEIIYWSCHAVHRAGGREIYVNGKFNESAFEPTVKYADMFNFMWEDGDNRKEIRVLALLFMHHIAKDEEKA